MTSLYDLCIRYSRHKLLVDFESYLLKNSVLIIKFLKKSFLSHAFTSRSGIDWKGNGKTDRIYKSIFKYHTNISNPKLICCYCKGLKMLKIILFAIWNIQLHKLWKYNRIFLYMILSNCPKKGVSKFCPAILKKISKSFILN